MLTYFSDGKLKNFKANLHGRNISLYMKPYVLKTNEFFCVKEVVQLGFRTKNLTIYRLSGDDKYWDAKCRNYIVLCTLLEK